MKLATQTDLSAYLENDNVLRWMGEVVEPGDNELICQKWLTQSNAKRYVFNHIYGDLLQSTGKKVLDVGGGLTSFTRELAKRHKYTLVEMMAHDGRASKGDIATRFDLESLILGDWYALDTKEKFDIIIANDLFPNVDQRLGLFLNRFLGQGKEIRLSLTFYEEPRFYQARRIDADEYLCLLAWNGEALKNCLVNFADRIVDTDFDIFDEHNISVYPNGRQVCLTTLR